MAYELFLNRFIGFIDVCLTGTLTPNKSGPGNNGQEYVLHTHQISRTEVSSSEAV